MAIIGHVDARVLAQDLVDQSEMNTAFRTELDVINESLKDTLTKAGFTAWYRGRSPQHLGNGRVDFDTLQPDNYFIRGFGDGSTNAPPLGKASYFFLEVIRTHGVVGGSTGSILQRAWDFKTGLLFTRTALDGRWGEWIRPSEPKPDDAPTE